MGSDEYIPAYGYSPNVTSWGGNAIFGDDEKYHLFVSEIPGGLSRWTSGSQIVHAVADDPMSIFQKVDMPLPAEAHNAAPIRAPEEHAACPKCWYLFHIGASNSTSNFAHRAKSPYGPWDPVPEPEFAKFGKHGCNNPAPAFATNGTLFVVCGSVNIYRADNDPMNSTGWTSVTIIDESGWTDGHYLKVEDAFLWQDMNNNWHLLTHRYDYRDGFPANPNQTEPVLVAGHAYSKDLFSWHLSPDPPFDSKITFVSGKVKNFATMERPHLIFRNGIPTHSLHGVSPIWDQYGAPCNICDPRPGSAHSCVVCKTTQGYDWTYTLVQKLHVPSSLQLLV